MRVPNYASYLTYLRELQRNQQSYLDAQMKVTTGKRIQKPSDDPVAASDIVRLSGEQAEADQFTRNVDMARSRLSMTDSVLDNVEQMLQRVQGLAQSSLGNPSQATAYTTEIDGLRDQILSAANTTHGGRYIFGGTVLTAAPYSKSGTGVVSYAGNSIPMTLQVNRDTTLQIQLPGTDVFSGSVDVFQTLADLTTAIQAGNSTGVQTQLQNLQQIFSELSTARTRVGGYMNLADGVASHLSSAGLLRARNVNEVQNADAAQAITELSLSQTNLQATLAVGARLTQLSLLDYL